MYIGFSLGFQEKFIFQWTLTVNLKKKNYDFLFRVSRNFLRISPGFFNFPFREIFAKLKENLAKREIDNFAKFSRKHENEKFRSHPTYSYSTIKEESQNNLFQTD